MRHIFSNQRASILQLLSYILILSALLFADLHSATVQNLRNKLSVVVYPLQLVVDSPIKLANYLAGSLRSQRDLLAQNANLLANEKLLKARLQKLTNLKQENSQLHLLLSARSRLAQNVLVANLLAINTSGDQRALILDRGTQNGAKSGQAVLDAYGVAGQVVNSSSAVSKVLLVTDRRSSVPVEDYRSGLRALANGDGSGLELFAVPSTADVRVGDLFVASGLGLRFPAGYPVGVVSSIATTKGDKFATINLFINAHLNSSQQYLLVESNKSKQILQAKALIDKRLPVGGQHAS